jgi:hypothetical protein
MNQAPDMSSEPSTIQVVAYREPGTSMPVNRRVWILLALGASLLFGGFIRFYGIAHESLWPDEFWSVYISTGRGDGAFMLPGGKLLDPPPPEMMAGAPSWIHIWTGMGTAVHPPLYHILLRWWMDLFGEGDAATRSLSAILSLVGIVLLFDVVRRTSGLGCALAAAAVMTLAASQIDFSQETRSYTMIVALGLIAIQAVVRIEHEGANRMRLVQLGIATVALLLTHYFTCFALAGLGAYLLIRLRGSDRTKAFWTLAGATVFAAALWSPWFLEQHRRNLMEIAGWSRDSHPGFGSMVLPLIYLPAFHLYFREENPIPWVLAVITFVFPLLFVRRAPQLLIWWFWMMGALIGLTVFDVTKHAALAIFPKYTFLASPAICAIVAAPLPWRAANRKIAWFAWALPGLIVLSMFNNIVSRLQEGPTPKADWRLLSQMVDAHAGPTEPLVFYTGRFWRSPAFWYLAFNHYCPQSHRPIMVLYGVADADALAELAKYPSVYVVGEDAEKDGPGLLPGWMPARGMGYGFQMAGSSLRMVRSKHAYARWPLKLPEPSPGPPQ